MLRTFIAALVATVTCSVHWVSTAGYAYRAPVAESSVEPTGHTPTGRPGYTPLESCRVSDVEIAGQGTGDALLSQDTPARPADRAQHRG